MGRPRRRPPRHLGVHRSRSATTALTPERLLRRIGENFRKERRSSPRAPEGHRRSPSPPPLCASIDRKISTPGSPPRRSSATRAPGAKTPDRRPPHLLKIFDRFAIHADRLDWPNTDERHRARVRHIEPRKGSALDSWFAKSVTNDLDLFAGSDIVGENTAQRGGNARCARRRPPHI